MMPRQVRTDLLLSMKTQGFAKGQQETARVSREAQKAIDAQVKGFATSGKSMQVVEKEIGRLEEVLQGLAVKQAAINREMEKVGDKGAKEYKALAVELKTVRQEAGQVTSTITGLDRAFMKARASRQGFAQGLMQGFAPGVAGYLQRGPGMRQQMIGSAVGGAARRGVQTVGRGARAAGTTLTGGMFAGAQGVAQGLGSLPLVGGILGSAASRALAQAQQRMQAQQVQLQTMPFLGGVMLPQRAREAGRQAAATLPQAEIERQAQRDRTHQGLLPTRDHYQQAQDEIRKRKSVHTEIFKKLLPKAGMVIEGAEKIREGLRTTKYDEMGVPIGLEEGVEERAMAIAGAEAEKRTRGKLTKERARRGRQARQRVMGQLELGMGTQFGMDINAERQFRAQVMQAGGGGGFTEQGVRMSRTAMAAQTAFGIGPGVSGAFLQAGRRGGLVGAEGRASEAMVEAVQEGFKLGFSEVEMGDYLAQIASGINAWKTTGIPFNKQSMADIAGTLGGMGMGGVRGMAVAGGVSRAAEQLSRTGPQSVGQLMMLQTMGGLKGTGMKAMEEALIKLEEKDFRGADFKKFLDQLTAAGGGKEEGRRVAYGVLSSMNIDVTRGELKKLDEGTPIKTWEQERERRIAGKAMAEGVAKTPEALMKAAAEAVPNALKEQAKLTNRQIANGKDLIKSMAQLEAVAQTMTESMTKLLAPLFEKLGIATEDLAGNIKNMQTKATNWVESVEPGP